MSGRYCPVCFGRVTDVEWNAEVWERYEGGVVGPPNDYSRMPETPYLRTMAPGPTSTTFGPCGHRVTGSVEPLLSLPEDS